MTATLLVFWMLASHTVFSATPTGTTWSCVAADYVRQQGRKLEARGLIEFVESTNVKGLRKISNITGYMAIHVLPPKKREREFEEYDYQATFNIAELTEHPRYTSRRYPNHSQFRDFNTHQTEGRDAGGMWGRWHFEKLTTPNQPSLQASYVFQAGDHLGGTLDFVCNRRN